MESQKTLAERVIIGGSIMIMPLIFTGQIVLGFYLILSLEIAPIIAYVITGMVITWIQYSVFIVFFSEVYSKWILRIHPRLEALPNEE